MINTNHEQKGCTKYYSHLVDTMESLQAIGLASYQLGVTAKDTYIIWGASGKSEKIQDLFKTLGKST